MSVAGKLIGQRAGVAIVGTLGIESGPADIAAAAAGGYVGGELGSAIEDYLVAQKTPNQPGQEGEAAVRERYEVGDKLPFEINGRSRIADGLIQAKASVKSKTWASP